MLQEIKIIALAIAFFAPFLWAITYLIDGVCKQKSRIFILFLMLAASLVYFMTFMKFEGHLGIYTLLFPVHAGMVLTLFPLLYLYLKSLTSEKRLTVNQIIPHFILAFVFFLFFIIYERVMLNSADDELFIRSVLGLTYDAESSFILSLGKWIYRIGKLMFVVLSVVYVYFSFTQVKDYYRKQRDLFSDNVKNHLNWLKMLGIFFIFMMLAHLVIHILNNSQVINNDWLIIVSYSLFAMFFWILGINVFMQKEVFDPLQVIETETFEEEIKISKEELEKYLLDEKPYLDPEISVYDFCYHFQTNRTYLSDAISKGLGLNFRGLINQYRVREAVDIIDQYKKMGLEITLEIIAHKSGFSSYSSFLRVFKSELGITPNEYVKNKIVNDKN
ncbi:MAG: helix-turn-helix transcriptional regulator [Bacteroidales bacterium]|nr:helix-turn-helix transcriptional regulator [Bacteroidales bacterium]